MTTALQELVAQALAANVRLRAAGQAGRCRRLRSRTVGCSIRSLSTSPSVWTHRWSSDTPERAAPLRFVQCGIGVAQLSALLRHDGLSLKTSGANNGQTLAGAISTGTHGAALDVGAMQDAVCGLHLIPDARRSLWLERASHPVVTPAFATALGAELRRDDALFEAALVSFGSFGIIHGLLIEAEPALSPGSLSAAPAADRAAVAGDQRGSRSTSLTLPHPGERPYHWQVVFNLLGQIPRSLLRLFRRCYCRWYERLSA